MMKYNVYMFHVSIHSYISGYPTFYVPILGGFSF